MIKGVEHSFDEEAVEGEPDQVQARYGIHNRDLPEMGGKR
jgi:hypothetical protein